MLRKWDDLPSFMKSDEVRVYYDSLVRKRTQLRIKQGFDYVTAFFLVFILFIPMLVIAVLIKADSPGPVLFRQKRVTAYGKYFNIHKFRTMYVDHKDRTDLTVWDDPRITRAGKLLRRTRLDELPQLFDVLAGHMSFVGTRPEVPAYVKQYSKEMYATLLLPAGITSRASICFRNEAELLKGTSGAQRDQLYVEQILPEKMKENLKEVRSFSIVNDMRVLLRTVSCILRD